MFGKKKEEKNINNLNSNKKVINSNAPRHVNNQQLNRNVQPNYQNPNGYNQQPSRRNNGQQYSANPQGRNAPRNNPQPPMPSQNFQNRQNNFNNNQNVPMGDQRNFNSNYSNQNNAERHDYSRREEEQVNNDVQTSPNRRNRQPASPRVKRGNGGKIFYVIVLAAIVIGLIAYIGLAISQMI